MIEEKTLNQIIALVFVAILLFFTYMILKPIFIAILFGLILAYMFNPLDKLMLKFFKNKTLTAFITCIIALVLGFIVVWFLIPVLIRQIFDIYVSIQSFDIVGFLKKIFPPLFSSPQTSAMIESSFSTFLTNLTNLSMQKLNSLISDFPSLVVKSLTVLVVFFYALRDGDDLLTLLRDSLPFKKEITNKFIDKSKHVTFGVIYGRVVTGIIIGLLTGITFFLLHLKNGLLFTFLTMIAAIIPVVGPWLVWVPIVVSIFISGKIFIAVLLTFYYGVLLSLLDHFLHGVFISRRAHVPTSLTLIGLIGGLFVFGLIGIILGPLIMAYLLVLFDIYLERNKKEQVATQ